MDLPDRAGDVDRDEPRPEQDEPTDERQGFSARRQS